MKMILIWTVIFIWLGYKESRPSWRTYLASLIAIILVMLMTLKDIYSG
jgi:hypothetical protein